MSCKTLSVPILGVTTLLIIGMGINVILMVHHQLVNAAISGHPLVTEQRRAPITTSGDNIYVVWWTNQTANGDGEIMFRASNDSGATFADKINLSNNTVTNSVDAEIAAGEDGKVIVTWWERNQTAQEPVARISSDNGVTFGPLLKLANDGTMGNEGMGNIILGY